MNLNRMHVIPSDGRPPNSLQPASTHTLGDTPPQVRASCPVGAAGGQAYVRTESPEVDKGPGKPTEGPPTIHLVNGSVTFHNRF